MMLNMILAVAVVTVVAWVCALVLSINGKDETVETWDNGLTF